MELVEAINKRKTARGYKTDPVPQEILQEIVDRKNNKKIKAMFDLARVKYKDILKNTGHYRLPDDKVKEIDNLVSKAYKDIAG